MKPEAVIFDIGNVLIEWKPERFFDAQIGVERRARFFADAPLYEMMDRIDEGEDFAATIEAYADSHPAWHAEILMFRDDWLRITDRVIAQSVRTLLALKAAGVPVFALSNFGSANFPMSCEAHPFLNAFDKRYISGDMGMKKPDAAIYAALEASCGIPAERLLFTDDRDENIEAAKARGWQTHLFDSAEGWAQALVGHGLLSEEQAQ